MNFFLDTEFAEVGTGDRPTIDLISIGIVCEDGRQIYLESSEFNIDNCDDWVIKNVLTLLGPPADRLPRAEIAKRVQAFLGEAPTIWAYYASFDWVVFAWLFGKMIDLPKGYPMFPMDLQQWWIQLGRPPIKPAKPTSAHNALEDAKWNLKFYNNLMAYEASRGDR